MGGDVAPSRPPTRLSLRKPSLQAQGRARHRQGRQPARAGAHAEDWGGVRVYSREGRPPAHIALPDRGANLCSGGAHPHRLVMVASHSPYAL